VRATILVLALALTLGAPQPAAASGDIDAIMAQLTGTPATERAAAFAKLSSAQQAGVLERVRLANVTVSKGTAPIGRPPGNASPSFSGCYNTFWTIFGNNSIGQHLWAHNAKTSWCDNGSTITYGSGYGYGQVFVVMWFYRSTTGHNTAGAGFNYYERFDQSTFEACLLMCFNAAYPWTNTHDSVGGGGWLNWAG
jgi:hypothetical protein